MRVRAKGLRVTQFRWRVQAEAPEGRRWMGWMTLRHQAAHQAAFDFLTITTSLILFFEQDSIHTQITHNASLRTQVS